MNAEQLQAEAEKIATFFAASRMTACADQITDLVDRAVREGRADEREECAKVCGKVAQNQKQHAQSVTHPIDDLEEAAYEGRAAIASECAAAIRRRGE